MFIGGGVISWGSRVTTKVATSKSWPAVSGTILSAAVIPDSSAFQSGAGNIRYDVDVRYRFIVNGDRYESIVIILGAAKTFADSGSAAKALEAYPTGSDVTVYYEPGNPARSTLEHGTGTQGIGMTTLTGGMFLLIGLLLAISGAIGWARSELVGR